MLTNNIQQTHDKAFPKHKFPPWITPGIVKSCKTKNRILYRKSHTNSQEVTDRYKTYSFLLVRLIKTLKCNYLTTKLAEFKSNMKETWRILNMVTGRHKKKPPIQSLLIDNDLCEEKKQIADALNNNYIDVKQKIRSEIPDISTTFTSYLRNRNPQSLFMHPLTEHDIVNIVHKLASKMSTGHDNISTKLLKLMLPTIVKALIENNKPTHIWNYPISAETCKVNPFLKAQNQLSIKITDL